MEIFELTQDVKVLYIAAPSFPIGIQAAFDTLNKKVGKEGRTYYGLSKPINGNIAYKAAVAESFDGEADQLGCKTYVIPKGKYLTESIQDWKNNMDKFATVFQNLLASPQLDWSTYCVEWYKSDDEALCMVKLQDK